MSRFALVVEAGELLGAVGLVASTGAVPAFADMALALRVLAVFIAIEDRNRLYDEAVGHGVVDD